LCPLDKLLDEIRQLFMGREAIPMNYLAGDLEKILLKQAN
jgi:hypothetical protein